MTLNESQSLGELDNREELEQQSKRQIEEQTQAFLQGGYPQVEAPALKIKMRECAPGLLFQKDWPEYLPIVNEGGQCDGGRYD